MKLFSLSCLALVTAAAWGQSAGDAQNPFQFKRTFRANEVSQYQMTIDDPAGTSHSSVLIQSTVTEVSATGATQDLKLAVTTSGASQPKAGLDFTAKFDAMGMPLDIPAKTGVGYLTFAAAGVTANAALAPGGLLNIDWHDTAGDESLKGKGKVATADPIAKTLTVDWILILTVGPDQAAYKITSVYSIDGYDLLSSKGTIAFAGRAYDYNVSKVTSAAWPLG